MAKRVDGEAAATAVEPAAQPQAVEDQPPPKVSDPNVVVDELPRSIIRRVVKEKLAEICGPGGELTINKDALLAFAESTRIFIHYLSATANDICKESKRLTIGADDVLKALTEIDFPEFIEPLQASLEDFRKKNAVKKHASKAKESDKRKLEGKENDKEDGPKDMDEEAKEDDYADGTFMISPHDFRKKNAVKEHVSEVNESDKRRKLEEKENEYEVSPKDMDEEQANEDQLEDPEEENE